jgi:hypothetical protein
MLPDRVSKTVSNARLIGRLTPTVHDLYTGGDSIITHFDGAATTKDAHP